jgi:restriction endonuclease S subunit
MVVENYRPKIKIDPEWQKYKIGEVFDTTSGGTPLKEHKEYYEGGVIPWLRSGEVSQGYIYESEKFITNEGLENSSAKLFPIDTVLVAMYGATAGQVGLLKFESTTNQAICGILPNEKVIPDFLYLSLLSQTEKMVSLSSGGAQPNISQTIIKKLKVAIPSLEEQKKEVDRIKEETDLAISNKKLIKIFEEKIDSKISEVWGEKSIGDK